jgi:hypothetical protein
LLQGKTQDLRKKELTKKILQQNLREAGEAKSEAEINKMLGIKGDVDSDLELSAKMRAVSLGGGKKNQTKSRKRARKKVAQVRSSSFHDDFSKKATYRSSSLPEGFLRPPVTVPASVMRDGIGCVWDADKDGGAMVAVHQLQFSPIENLVIDPVADDDDDDENDRSELAYELVSRTQTSRSRFVSQWRDKYRQVAAIRYYLRLPIFDTTDQKKKNTVPRILVQWLSQAPQGK